MKTQYRWNSSSLSNASQASALWQIMVLLWQWFNNQTPATMASDHSIAYIICSAWLYMAMAGGIQ